MYVPVPDRHSDYYETAYAWGGQHTIASSAVSRIAITTATETAANMLRHRPDIAARLAEAGSALAIIPGNETTKSIPEHAPFPATKGYGATTAIPVSSVTENNILRLPWPQNDHPTQNITVHEFAHAIENLGFDAPLRAELTAAYTDAMAAGLWANTYAATNEDEYFAEMANAFFDHERTPDAATNFVNTRAELAEYDPAGFALLVKVFGNDSWRDGDWAGSNGADVLTGLDTDDFLFGHGGADQISGAGGDDTIDGGDGFDTARYVSGKNSYHVQMFAEGVTVTQTGNGGDDGQDRLYNVERLMLGEDEIRLDAIAQAATLSAEDFARLTELYIAYFDRAPDAEGLFFWGAAFANGTTLEAAAALFFDQVETRATYPDPSDTAGFVTQVYGNVLGRGIDQAGFDFWTSVLDSGAVAPGVFILEILKGAKAAPPADASADFVAQQMQDQAYLENKTDIGVHVAGTLGLNDTDDLRAIMSVYDGSAASISATLSAAQDVYDAAVQEGSGDFVLQLVGLIDDPFAIA